MSHNDLHLTIEQFSDFISDRLPLQERALVEEHLQHCAQCQEELTNLRRVVAMLHALPRPEPPRSFTLPADVKNDTNLTPLFAATSRPSRLRAAGRAISLLAAVVGIALLLSSLISLPPGGVSTLTTSQGGSVGPQRHGGTQPNEGGITPFTPANKSITPSATATPQLQQTHTSSTPPPPLLDFRSAAVRAIFGLFLLVIGLVGALILWRKRYSLP